MTSLGISDLESNEGSVNSLMTKRLNKLLDTRLENNKEILEGLQELSLFFKENTLKNRRNLRSQIEKRSLSINQEFLKSFKEIKSSLDKIHEDATSLNNCVEDMTSRLHATKTQTSSLIDQTNKLQAECQKLTIQEELVQAFLSKFQLTQLEIEHLKGKTRDSPITDEFFIALEKTKKIHADCRILLQYGHHTIALDIMEQMSLFQESALERLYRWTQTHCRNIDSSSTSQIIAKSLTYLQDRPVLFKCVLEEYASSRRAILVRGFLDALTTGGRPIEAKSSDPRRYIGDMLAWLHQAIPDEKDSLNSLLGQCQNIDVTEHIQLSLSSISEGVCAPLRVRVEQALVQESEAANLLAVANLLRYYLDPLSQVVPRSTLEATLSDLHELSAKTFLSSLHGHVRRLMAERGVADQPPASDLSASAGVSQLLALLRDVLNNGAVTGGAQKHLDKIVACVVEPLLQAVNEGASRLPTVDMAVYLLNCLHQLQSTLSVYEFIDQRLERLQAQTDAQLDTLTAEQASSLVANLNLGPIYTILQERDKSKPLSATSGMELPNLQGFLEKFEKFISMSDALLLPQINLLTSNAHRTTVQQRANQVIAAIYRQLYKCVHDPTNLYSEPERLFKYNPDQVDQILTQTNN